MKVIVSILLFIQYELATGESITCSMPYACTNRHIEIIIFIGPEGKIPSLCRKEIFPGDSQDYEIMTGGT